MLPFDNFNYENQIKVQFYNKGKVRNLYELELNNQKYLILQQSQRCSAFDYHICDINNKGFLLTEIAAFWFQNQFIKNIVQNHYISHKYNLMLVKKHRPIKLEFICRGYITGSCWRAYQSGKRSICGEDLPDNLVKNQRFTHKFPLITPTTKGEHDEPITLDEIVSQNYLTRDQVNYIVEVSTNLFKYGHDFCLKNNILMADTKYEFGFDDNDNIVLIDEIHTPDSSRFWCLESYQKCQEQNDFTSLVNLDKDIIRNYLVTQGFPKNTQTIPEVPDTVKTDLENKYDEITLKFLNFNKSPDDYSQIKSDYLNTKEQFTEFLSSNNSSLDQQCDDENNLKLIKELVYNNFNNRLLTRKTNLVVVVAGSKSDKSYTDSVLNKLSEKNILGGVLFSSAHKETLKVVKFIKDVEANFDNVVWVTMAGMSNALSGVISANTKFPTIGCPVFKDQTDMLVNINSTIQMPSKVPVMTVLSHGNVALACQKIFNLLN